MRVLAVALACLCTSGLHAATVEEGCLPRISLPLTVRIGNAPAAAAQLEGGLEAPLTLFEPGSGRRLWWAGAHRAATQVFPGMTAGFTGSLAAVDLDGDGLQDRLYAGDMAGRLWRFDLHHGAEAASWASGGVFADFSNDEGRVFLAAPDISLSSAGTPPRLAIAIGTAAPGNAAANNRFYVLHDMAEGTWTGEDFEDWQPLREEDLTRIEATVQAATTAAVQGPDAGPGWFIELGQGHVIAPSLTVHDRAVLAIATAVPRRPGPCEVFVHIASVDLVRPQVAPADDGATGTKAWRLPLREAVPASAALELPRLEGGVLRCDIGGQRVAACDVDTRPRRTWWRRADAQ